MNFSFFKKENNSQVREERHDSEVELLEEDLDKVDAGYLKTQDDINRILAGSKYVNESSKSELNDMLDDDKNIDKISKSARK